jgi:hypothetical protein
MPELGESYNRAPDGPIILGAEIFMENTLMALLRTNYLTADRRALEHLHPTQPC